jgi:hypothetical protein
MQDINIRMAFSFDSPLAFCGALLGAVAVLAWRLVEGCPAGIRLNLRFAAILFAALSTAALIASLRPSFAEIMFAIGLLVIALAPMVLALSVAPRAVPAWAASLALVMGLGAGLFAAAGDAPLPALASQVLSAASMTLMALARWRTAKLASSEIIAAASALALGGMAWVNGAATGALLLLAAGLLGLAVGLQPRVEQPAGALVRHAIGRPRF